MTAGLMGCHPTNPSAYPSLCRSLILFSPDLLFNVGDAVPLLTHRLADDSLMVKPNALRLALLTELREAAGLTLSEMAIHCGLLGKQSRLTVAAWERGEMIPTTRRRIHFPHYLWDALGLRKDPERFAAIWDLLCEEWGWEPLTDQEWQRLTHAPRPQPGSTMPVARSATTPPPVAVPPFQAPPLAAHFVERPHLVQQIREALLSSATNPALVALVGMGGLGKTTLATQLAHALRPHFQDGLLWAQTAISSPLDILQSWARALGYDYSELHDVESCAAALRSALVGRQLLFVLDNVEGVQRLQPLLVGGAQSALLITTRSEDVAVALGSQVIPLAEFTSAESSQLLVNLLGHARVAREQAAAHHIGDLLHHLPLAVEIAGQLLAARSRRTLAQMAQRLHDLHYRLDLQISDRDVRTSFLVSWEALDDAQQRLFAHLAVFAGRSFTVTALVALLAEDEDRLLDQLDLLVARSLVKEVGDDRYCQHPLLADFAREQLGDDQTAYQHFSDYYYRFVQAHSAQYERLLPEWGNVAAAIRAAHRQARWPLLLAYANCLAHPWLTQARYADAREAYELIHDAAEALGDEAALATNLVRWGGIAIEQNEYDEAETHLSRALSHWMNLEEDQGVATAQFNLARIAIDRGDFEKAEVLLTSALELRSLVQDQQGIATIKYYQARICFAGEQLTEAAHLLQEAMATQTQIAANREAIPTLRLLAQLAAKEEKFAQALSYCQQAQALCESLQEEAELATVYYTWAIMERRQGDYLSAKAHAQKARLLFQKLGLRRLEGMILYQLGAILKEIAEEEEALHYTLESVRIFTLVQNSFGKLFSLILLGDLYTVCEQAEESQRRWREAEALAHELNNHTAQELLRTRLG